MSELNVYVLVKDWGYEGLSVHGVVTDRNAALMWKAGDTRNDYIYSATDSFEVIGETRLETWGSMERQPSSDGQLEAIGALA